MKLGSLVAVQGPSDSHLAHRGAVTFTLCGKSLIPDAPEASDVSCKRCRSSAATELRTTYEHLAAAIEEVDRLQARRRFLESVLGLTNENTPQGVHTHPGGANMEGEDTSEGTAA